MTDIRSTATSPSAKTQPPSSVEIVESSAPITVVPDAPSETTHQPATQQIFAKAAIYRPITIAASLAAVLFMFYGVFAAGSLLTSDGAPNDVQQTLAPPGPVAVSLPADAAPEACSLIEVETFLDFDGNGVRNEGELAAGGVPITVRSAEGMEFVSDTDENGMLAFQLSTPARLSLEADPMQAIGMWPAPRLGALAASEIVLSGPDCSSSLGYLWVPPGAQTPRVGWAPGSTDEAPVPAEPVSALLGQAGGVQTYGRLWYDLDGDGMFSLADEPGVDVSIVLLDEAGQELTRLESNELGAYSFVGLMPNAVYEIRVDAPVAAARALGWAAENPTSSAFVRTGATGLPVWGVDFILGDPAAEPAVVGDLGPAADRAS